MYLQFKEGFIEADRWDGSLVPDQTHQNAIDCVEGDAVIVVRSREKSTIAWVVHFSPGSALTLRSPLGWDYEWRCYLSVYQWRHVLAQIAADLDYRNFKAWSAETRGLGRRKPGGGYDQRERLAGAIWRAAHDAFASKEH